MMTEVEWLGCGEPQLLLQVVGDKPGKRRLRLAAVGAEGAAAWWVA
jgi:hypothetical protein